MNDDPEKIFKEGCELIKYSTSILDLFFYENIISDTDCLNKINNDLSECRLKVINIIQKNNLKEVDLLPWKELDKHLLSRSNCLTWQIRRKWPTLTEHLDSCYLSLSDFDWLGNWLETNLNNVKNSYSYLMEKYPQNSGFFISSPKLEAFWEKEIQKKSQVVLEILSDAVNDSNLKKEISKIHIMLSFYHNTSYTDFNNKLIGLKAKQICRLVDGQPKIITEGFLSLLYHELGHYLNRLCSNYVTKNPFIQQTSELGSFNRLTNIASNSVVDEEIAEKFSEVLYDLVYSNDKYLKELGIVDTSNFDRLYKSIKLSSDYYFNLKAYSILALAQKQKKNFNEVAGSISKYSIDFNYANWFIAYNTSDWLEDGTPPPETLYSLRYYTGLAHKIFAGKKLTLKNPEWLTGLWTPQGYKEWLKLSNLI